MSVQLHHADLIIPPGAEGEAREFYCGLLGIPEIQKPAALKKNGGLWLQLGNAQVHLSFEKREGVDPRKTKAHLAFTVSDLKAVGAKLEQRGLPVKPQEPLPGMLRMESEDPFGHRLEFVQLV